IKWTRINATTHDIEESGTIGDSTHDYYYGSIAVNPTGQVVIGYTRSGSTQFASSYASVGQFNGTATQFLLPTLLQAGAGNYNVTGGGSNRWGDYSQTTIDPLDSLKFWTIEEYASGTNTWSTAITEIDFAAAPEPSSLAMLLLIGATLSLRRRRQPRPSGTLAFGG
ncbi:MAG TPA: PEP-CTERM sorting domain-containing protein, partial [Tepidisphaeraceae bacterium]|nr:PEP-CTERM sorting domain-containing protein [Tepidisphaeraceae bacterium]